MTMGILFAGGTMAASAQTAAPQASQFAPPSAPAKNATAKKTSESKAVGWGGLEFTPSSSDRFENSFSTAPKHFLLDQKAMWTSPLHMSVPEATWLVPVAGFTAGLFATDSDFMRQLSHNPSTLTRYDHISNYGLGAMGGVAGGAYVLGLITHNEHERETGFLSGEAAVDSLVATEAIAYMTRRERPLVDNANGQFWRGGDSFPSDHSAAAWSIAGIVAHEYPSPLVKLFSYGAATAISISRIKAEKHFPSDVVVGSAIGWLVSQYVYKEHHSPGVAGGPWELLGARPDGPEHWQAKAMGSPYVLVDSWIYPALMRLAALGYVKSDIEGMRPWTRMECARLIDEAEDKIADSESVSAEANELYDSLEKEFAKEINLLGGGNNRDAELESVYTRVTGISGEPLTDGYHFGQTIVNDYGRPYEEGFNNVTGFSGWASDGPLVGYVDGEYQHAPSAPALPATALQAIAQEDNLPATPPATPIASTNQFQLLDSYVGMNFGGWQITFGKQSQWWGPDSSGPMDISDNAEPLEMLQVNRVSPFRLPSLLGIFGPIRADFFLGQVTGQHFILVGNNVVGTFSQQLNPQPFVWGEKVSFKPTRDLEIGLGLTTLTGGPGDPFTFKKFLEALAPDKFFGGGLPGTPDYYGNGHSEVDFTYRIPGLRNWLTLYADGFNQDEPSPLLGTWNKAAWTAGIYLPTIPGIPKLDFRAEGIYSDPPIGGTVSHGFFYIGSSYKDGYTNAGNLMGSWIGRQGQGAQAWSTYWFTPKDKLQFSFRHQKVSQQFVPFGGTLTDGGVNVDLWARSMFSVSASLQYEVWNFPVLASTKQTDVSTSVQFTFWPRFGHAKVDTSAAPEDSSLVP
ncbi:MAG: capsule assembly Wzi family protein [Candidatus Acidiferrales bacterium]